MQRVLLVAVALALLPPEAGAGVLERLRPDGPYREPYREALAAWAAGDEAQAMAAVSALAEEVTDGRTAAALQRSKRRTARSLARRQPDVLLAMARFEVRSYHAHAHAGRMDLAVAARQLAADLAEEHARRTREGAPGGGLLAALGGHFHGAQEVVAWKLYERALAVDPQQPAALLGLAALREKRGDYAGAVALLGTIAPPPGGRAGRLRLAVNLLRIGRSEEGVAALRELAATGDDWVRTVAAQELARALAQRGETAAAGALLAAAMAAAPCDSSLAAQAAFLAERAGTDRPLDLGALAACPETAVAPRSRYLQPPRAEQRALHDRLEALERDWRAALRRALAR